MEEPKKEKQERKPKKGEGREEREKKKQKKGDARRKEREKKGEEKGPRMVQKMEERAGGEDAAPTPSSGTGGGGAICADSGGRFGGAVGTAEQKRNAEEMRPSTPEKKKQEKKPKKRGGRRKKQENVELRMVQQLRKKYVALSWREPPESTDKAELERKVKPLEDKLTSNVSIMTVRQMHAECDENGWEYKSRDRKPKLTKLICEKRIEQKLFEAELRKLVNGLYAFKVGVRKGQDVNARGVKVKVKVSGTPKKYVLVKPGKADRRTFFKRLKQHQKHYVGNADELAGGMIWQNGDLTIDQTIEKMHKGKSWGPYAGHYLYAARVSTDLETPVRIAMGVPLFRYSDSTHPGNYVSCVDGDGSEVAFTSGSMAEALLGIDNAKHKAGATELIVMREETCDKIREAVRANRKHLTTEMFAKIIHDATKRDSLPEGTEITVTNKRGEDFVFTLDRPWRGGLYNEEKEY